MARVLLKQRCPHGYNAAECGTCVNAEKSAGEWARRQRDLKKKALSSERVEESTPAAYKLKRKVNEEYVLMAAIKWTQGTDGGIEWRELETIIETPPEPAIKHSPDCASLTRLLLVYPARPAPCDCGGAA